MTSDNTIEFKLTLDAEEVGATIQVNEEMFQKFAAKVEHVNEVINESINPTNTATQAYAGQGVEVDKLTNTLIEGIAAKKAHSAALIDGVSNTLNVISSVASLVEKSDGATESQKKFAESVSDGITGYNIATTAVEGLALAMGTTVSGGLTMAIGAVVSGAILLKSILGENIEEIQKQKDEVDKLRESYSKFGLTSVNMETVVQEQLKIDEEKITKAHNDKLLELDFQLHQEQLKAQKATEIQLIQDKIEHLQKFYSLETDSDKRKEINEKVLAAENELNKAIEQSKKDYYEKVKFLDPNYMTEETQKIDDEVKKMQDAGFTEIEWENYKTEAIKELDQRYYDWKWQQYQKDNQLFTGSLEVMWRGYDEFFQLLTNKSMTDSEKLSAIWDTIEQGFIGMLANMLKEYLMGLLKQALFGDTAQLAAIGTATGTGAAIASAYAPAATFASVMSFGAADIAGMAGLSSATALSYLLAAPKIPGFAKGGAIVGENGIEIIAPAEDYATGMADLVTRTAFEVRNYFAGGSGIDNSSLINEVRVLNTKIENLASRPALAYFNNDEAMKVGQHYDYQNRMNR